MGGGEGRGQTGKEKILYRAEESVHRLSKLLSEPPQGQNYSDAFGHCV